MSNFGEGEGIVIKGLLIKEPWVTHILNGDKTWEIRSSQTKIRGEIHLIRSGSGLIVGTATIENSFPITKDDYIQNMDKHCIKNVSYDELAYKNPHAWVFNNPRWLKRPIPYRHKLGAVIWINID